MAEYLIDLNATATYKRAGYTAKGNAAEVNASRLLRKAKVAGEIQRREAERGARTETAQDLVIYGLRSIVDDDTASDSVRVRALELLGRHLGMWPNVPRRTWR